MYTRQRVAAGSARAPGACGRRLRLAKLEHRAGGSELSVLKFVTLHKSPGATSCAELLMAALAQ